MRTPDYEIVAIPLPTPFPVGDVNVYLLKADRLLLVDTGLEWEKDRIALKAGFARAGVAVEQVSEVVITHAHLDHCGLAGWIQEVSGAPVRAHPLDAPRITGFPGSVDALVTRYRTYSVHMGYPPEAFDGMIAAVSKAMYMARSARIERTLEEGDRLALGGAEFEILHTPGHTPGSICLYDRRNRVLFAGDTVLHDITPNPFFGGHTRNRLMGAATYLRTLQRLLPLDIAVSYGGHGAPVTDLKANVELVRTHHRARSEKILGCLADGPLTAWEIRGRIFGELGPADQWLAFAEILGHLEMLESDAAVRPVEDGAVTRFAALS